MWCGLELLYFCTKINVKKCFRYIYDPFDTQINLFKMNKEGIKRESSSREISIFFDYSCKLFRFTDVTYIDFWKDNYESYIKANIFLY